MISKALKVGWLTRVGLLRAIKGNSGPFVLQSGGVTLFHKFSADDEM